MTFDEYRERIAESPVVPVEPLRARWRIGRRNRWAELNGLTLVVGNHRGGILEPVRWVVQRANGEVVADGAVYRSKRYVALTREAMRQAEAAAMGS